MSKARLFVVDPMCVLDYGHNAQSVLYFSEYFTQRGFEVRQAVCKHFPLTGGVYAKFERTFAYYYQDFVPIRNPQARPLVPNGIDSPTLKFSTDPLERVAVGDFQAWMGKEQIGPDDYIFYPSVDFYGVAGLLGALASLPSERAPRIHLRFIGVMENATQRHANSLRYLRGLLDQTKLKHRISISAEAPVYAAHLTSVLHMPCQTTLYPLKADPQPLTRTLPFIVYSAGTARIDKGFLRLYEIIARYCELYPEDTVEFHIQGMRPEDEIRHVSDICQLYAAPNVRLHNAVQSDDEMQALYQSSHFLIMPYDSEIYRFRGSAVFMEGIAKGRPFAISAGTGFHPLVTELESAYNCTHDADFCAAIHECYSMDRSRLEERTSLTARHYEGTAAQLLSEIWLNLS